jgi:hypothetical protein
MTSPVLRAQRRRNGLPILAFIVIALVVAGAVVGVYMLSRGNTSVAAADPNASPDRLHVTDLMKKANCVGGVIGTQLHSYETGRCRLAGIEVTIAVFETGEQRDQWLASARQFDGTLVAGVGWAAGMNRPDAAPLLVSALGGQVV